MFRLSNIITALILGGVVLLMLGSLEAGSSSSYTCVLCRLYKVETTLYGFTHSTYDENECSLWYPRNIEPTHAHIWEPGTCRTLLNGLALPIGVGCSVGHYPIRLLDPSTQLKVYQHFKDRQAARTLFSGLTDAKTYNDRLEEDDPKGRLIVRSIQEWEIAGFPGNWDEWWGPWWDKHVAEHKEFLAWAHADSKLGFDEWKKRRGAASAPAK